MHRAQVQIESALPHRSDVTVAQVHAPDGVGISAAPTCESERGVNVWIVSFDSPNFLRLVFLIDGLLVAWLPRQAVRQPPRGSRAAWRVG
jgi:hypothetical protein